MASFGSISISVEGARVTAVSGDAQAWVSFWTGDHMVGVILVGRTAAEVLAVLREAVGALEREDAVRASLADLRGESEGMLRALAGDR